MTPFLLVVMIAMCGMALDLSRSYNRKAELQNVADGIAIAAASALDGTASGIDQAVTEAAQAAMWAIFAYSTDGVTWSSAALTFATSASAAPGEWMDAATAKLTPGKVLFARVDTSALDPRHGNVENYFLPILSASFATTYVSAKAVAGRDSLRVLPLAICANSTTAASSLPSGELVEFGFRRGISYNLMNLNPGGRSPESFLVNPFAPAGTVGTTMSDKLDLVAPFVCTGTVAIPTLHGGDISVERSFPLAWLYVHLNSRFGRYASPCVASTAPADPSVKSFDLDNVSWMKYRPDGLFAASLAAPDPLLTVAEKPDGATRTAYGPLWTFTKAAKYSSYVANGGVEPMAAFFYNYGYSPFSYFDWSALYNPGAPVPQDYPWGTIPHPFVFSEPYATPYQVSGGSANYSLRRNTRVLHVPLLRCPVPAGTSTTAAVVGIGKFFMTVPATASALYAEFAGAETEAAVGGNARLY